jgi:filamentous hemagglutinin
MSWQPTESAPVANPDQGAPAANAIVHADSVTNWSSTISFSSAYGSCSSDCIRLITEPDYSDPSRTILRSTQHSLAPVREQLEISRDAHHVVFEDQLAPGAGAVAQILSGENMRLTVSESIENRFSDIKAKGFLTWNGAATKNSVGATLYRTHLFDGTWNAYGGTITGYQQPTISEESGSVAAVIEGNQGVSISGRRFSVIDVAAGTVGNIRDAVNVIGSRASGANTAGAHVGATASGGGTVVAEVPVSVAAAAPGLANAVAATGGNSVLNASLDAAASGLGNHARAGGKASASGYFNKAVIATTVNPGGNTSNPINTSARDFVVTAGSSSAQPPGSVQSTAQGGITKIAPSGLFIRNPDAKSNYLFETRPQFANQRQWASSDYLLKQLEFDPAATQKRLGDGFYEQRLVREQLAELTGHKSYSGASDDSVYMQLLTNAVSAAKEFGLRPGIALSADQVRRLTSDIAWIESQAVMLPDGSTETVLVPKVYLAHVGARALQPGGALVTGNNVAIHTTETILNNGGVIDGGNGRTLLLAGQDIVNRGGSVNGSTVVLAADRDIRNESLAVTQTYDFGQNSGSHTSLSNQATITSAGELDIMAGRDLSDLAGKITAGSATLTAGHNVDFGTIRTGSTYQSQINGYTEKDSSITHQLSQVSTAGDLKIAATNDLNLTGTQVSVGTGGIGNGQLLAGRNINIAAVTNEVNTSLQNDPASKLYDKRVYQDQTLVGAGIATASNLTVGAGILEKGTINIAGSSVAAGEGLKLTATDSINVVSMQEKHLSDTASTRSTSSTFRSKTTQQADYVARSQAIGSALSGKTVDITAGKDINVLGSAIVGDDDVSLRAAGGINIGASTSTLTEKHHTQVKESGFLSGGGFGITYGTRTTTTDQSRDATTQSGQSRSLVGSIGGDLHVNAGDALTIGGSDLSGGHDMSLSGKSVAIRPGADDANSKFSTRMTQDGLTLAIGGSVVNAIQTAQSMSAAAAQTSNGRIKALAAAAAVMTAKDAAQDMAKNGPSVKISLTAGHSETESTEVSASRAHSGSVLGAANNVSIVATGAGKASNIDIVGSDVRGAGSVSLAADNQVNLLAAQDTESQHSQNKSWSAAVGVAAEIDSKGARYGITASASASRGNIDGEGTTQLNSHVTAGDRLTIASGGDTNLKGAVASGNQVVATVGGNLNIESLQDTAKLDGKRQSISASGTIGAGGGFSASASNSKVHNDYASVQEQSGIRAGDGGFQVKVGGNTDLKGAFISSSEQAISDGRNSLTTDTLSFSDIQNRDSSRASGISLGVNVGKNQTGDPFSPSMAPGIGQVKSSQGSVTRSGVSGATLTVADQHAGQAVASLNRDVSTAKDSSQALTKSWNGAQALDDVGAQMEITSAAMPRLANAIGNYAGTREAELRAQGNSEEAAKWAEGGIYRVAAHAALGAMGGGLGGAVGATAAAEAAPTLDKLQTAVRDKLADAGLGNDVANVAAKLIAGGAAGAIGGVAGGGAAAAAGLNADANNRQLHIDETRWIKKNAAKFAASQGGISIEEATKRLAQQASRDVDLVWRGVLADGVDKEAQAFLAQAQGQTFTNSFGQKQALFSTQEGQLTAAQSGLFEVDKAFINKYVTPYATRTALAGVNAGIGQAAMEVIDTLKHDPGGVAKQAGLSFAASAWNAVRHPIKTANELIESTESSAKNFGEGVAASTNKDIQRQLNSLYGQDVTSAVQIATGAQGALMLGSALGVGKAASQTATAARDAIKAVVDGKSLSAKALDLPNADVDKKSQTDNAFYRDAPPPVPVLSASGGNVIRADPNKTTTVLGTYNDDMNRIINKELEYPKSMNFLDPKPGYFNVLNAPDELYEKLGADGFWNSVNVPFLQSAISRGDEIYIATKPTANNVRNPNNSDGLSGFGREMKYLSDRGYVYDPVTGKMCLGGCK